MTKTSGKEERATSLLEERVEELTDGYSDLEEYWKNEDLEIKAFEKSRKDWKKGFCDATAISSLVNPPYAAIEIANGMSVAASIGARFTFSGLGYLGMGYIWGKGRDLSEQLFNFDENTSESTYLLHDTLYSGAFTLTMGAAIYTGLDYVDDWSVNMAKVMRTSASAAVLSVSTGYFKGAVVDYFRDLAGLEETNRPSYPAVIKKQTPATKKWIFAGAVAGSVALTGGVYGVDQMLEEQPRKEDKEVTTETAVQDRYASAEQNVPKLEEFLEG